MFALGLGIAGGVASSPAVFARIDSDLSRIGVLLRAAEEPSAQPSAWFVFGNSVVMDGVDTRRISSTLARTAAGPQLCVHRPIADGITTPVPGAAIERTRWSFRWWCPDLSHGRSRWMRRGTMPTSCMATDRPRGQPRVLNSIWGATTRELFTASESVAAIPVSVGCSTTGRRERPALVATRLVAGRCHA